MAVVPRTALSPVPVLPPALARSTGKAPTATTALRLPRIRFLAPVDVDPSEGRITGALGAAAIDPLREIGASWFVVLALAVVGFALT